MRVASTLILAAVLAESAMAFTCSSGSYGSCNFWRNKDKNDKVRCAITCKANGACSCPDYYPNGKKWKYTGGHKCITVGQYNGRNQCQNANPNGKRAFENIEGIVEDVTEVA